MSAATDNVGLFFGEDIFLAIASILLIQGALASFGIQLTPFQLSVWAIPSAICAFSFMARGCCFSTARLRQRRMINLHWLYVLRRSNVRRLRRRERARREQRRSRWGNALFWALAGGQLLVRRFPGRYRQRRAGSCSRRARWSSPARPRHEASRQRRKNASGRPSATATAVPAGSDHPVHGVRWNARCSTIRR